MALKIQLAGEEQKYPAAPNNTIKLGPGRLAAFPAALLQPKAKLHLPKPLRVSTG